MVEHPLAAPQMSLLDDVQTYGLAGDATATESYTFGGATVVLGDAGTVIIVEAGDRPDRSGVWSADEIRLLGPAPTPVRVRLVDEVWAGGTDGTAPPVHLMVRVPEGLLALGTGTVAQAGTELPPGRAEHVLTDCVLQLDIPLNRPALDRVRTLVPPTHVPGLDWLRHVNSDRAAALEQFVTGWYPATSVATETPSEETPVLDLPDGLRHFHQLARHRPEALGVQNRILPASELKTDPKGELVVFGEENQGGFYWSLLWAGDGFEADPTVWFREYDEPPIPEREPLSGFLLQFSLFEAAMGADYLALPRGLTGQQADHLTEGLHPVPLQPFWPWAPTRFYVAPGLVLYISDEGSGFGLSAWAGATHRSALAPFADAGADAGIEWTRFDG